MANPRYNTQVTNQRGGSARVGKMGGGMMMQRPMMKKGGKVKKDKKAMSPARKITGARPNRPINPSNPGFPFRPKPRVKKMGGGRIAGAARRAQEHGYYTPDMGMKGGKMYKSGGRVGKKKPAKVMGIGIGKIKDYPGMKKIIEMNKKGKKRFRDGGSALKPVDKSKNPGLAKLPTKVRNKMGYMKKGGRVHKNTARMNRLEELCRVDAERARTQKGKRNLKAEKKRIVKELKK
tara:strand:- start:69 stop:770 length:702 start_codon:yes stop_codon:yes gene_type:complete